MKNGDGKFQDGKREQEASDGIREGEEGRGIKDSICLESYRKWKERTEDGGYVQ